MKNFLTIALLFFVCICGYAQYKFDYFTTKEGLSTNRIGCIFRDSKGYLWVGTEIGIDRYDGYKIKTYRHNEKQTGTISNNAVWCFFEDRKKNLWISTIDGLNLYYPEGDSFQVFKNNPTDIHSIDNNNILSILEDTKGNLWVSTAGTCLNKWVPATKQFIRYPIRNSSGSSFMREDSKGNLWVVLEGLPGIYRFDPVTGKLKTYMDTTVNLGKNSKKLYIDKDDVIWVMTYGDGLFSFDPSSGKFEQFKTNGQGKGTNGKLVYDIIEEDKQHLWIGVDQGGINRFDKISRTFEYIMYNDRHENGLSNNGIWGIYKDNEGIIWVSTAGGGINIYNPKNGKFKLFRHNNNNPNSLSSNVIGCFHEDSKGMIWIGTDNNGLDMYNPKTKTFKSFKHNPVNPFSISSNTIRCTGEDESKDLWIGTWDKGFNRFDRKTGKFFCYMPDASNPASLSGTTVWHYIIDHKGIFWLAIHNIGIDLFDKKRGVIKRFVADPNNPKALSNAKIWFIYQDSNRNIWLCTNDGLNLYDSISQSFTVYKHLPSKNIKVITEDRDKNLWVGTEKGMCLIKANGKILQTYDVTNGLAGNIVHGIVCDNSSNLWISTNNGVSKFNPKTKTFKNFTEKDGLQDNAFFQQSFLKTRKGEIYFGGFNGFNSFFPDSIKVNTTIPPVYITEFQIFNKPVAWGVQGSPLQKQISETNEITLTHSQSVFSFGFTAINYTNPEKNQYAYKMEGFETDWNYTDATRRYVTYTNLNPGEYTFRVKASNNDGIWNEEGTSIKIIILPPWWGTWWFKLIAFIIILLLLSYILSRIIKKVVHATHQTILNERNQLKTLINNIPDQIFIKDIQSRFLVINNCTIEFMGGKNEKDFLNKTDFDFYPQEVAKKYFDQEQSIIHTGKSILNEENTVSKNDQILILSTTKCPIINSKGETIGLVGIVRDVTEQKLNEQKVIKQSKELLVYNEKLNETNTALEERQQQIEEQTEELSVQAETLKEANNLLSIKRQVIEKQAKKLQETNDKLTVLNATKDRFFSIIAHDLRNPFHLLIGFSELLLKNFEKFPADKNRKYLQMILESSTSGHSLLENLLQWSRTQTGHISFEPIRLKLNNIIIEAILLLSAMAEQKNILLESSINDNTFIFADENMVKTIIRNLISNAIKFTPDNGKINIKAFEQQSMIEITVSDTGVGIPEENLKKLFRIDTPVSTMGTQKEKGSGLGLLLCKEFIEKHGGKIWVESTEGKGSNFTFTFPEH